MSTYVDSHIISLTSNTATTTNGSLLSDTWFEFRGLLKDEPDILKRQISVVSAQIPVSFFNVNYTNNKFVFKATEDASYTTSYFPLGNYNGNSLTAALISFFHTELSVTVTITLSKIDGKITITRTPTGDIEFSPLSTCYEILGFQEGVTYTSEYSQLIPPHPINLLGVKTLQIKSPSLVTQNYSSNTGTHNTILATLSVDATLFGQINYHNYTDLRTTFSNVDLNGIDIQFYDENDNLIHFNGVNWSLTLAIHLTRKLNINPIPLSIGQSPLPNIVNTENSKTLDEQPKKDEVLSALE